MVGHEARRSMDDTRLGTLLLEGGIVAEGDLERCLAIQNATGRVRPLGEVLVEHGLLDPGTVQRLLQMQQSRNALQVAEVPPADALSASLLRAAVANGATELMVSEGLPARIRVAGDWRDLGDAVLDGPEVWQFVRETMGGEVLEQLAEQRFVTKLVRDTVHGAASATAFRHFDGVAVRIVPTPQVVQAPTELDLPAELVAELTVGSGLVLLVIGQADDRAALLSVLLQAALASGPRHAVALLDEPLPASLLGQVASRRFGWQAEQRAAALRSALSEDPEVVAIADIGTPEAFELALRAATEGRLVLACLNAANVVAALQRVLDFYPVAEVAEVRRTLAANLHGILLRTPLPNLAHTGIRHATEYLRPVPVVRETLAHGDLAAIPRLLQRADGSCGWSLDRSLLDLLVAGAVRLEDVFARAEEKAWLLERSRALPRGE
jgi:Tfp pilus assembly pilus retraction ATPase PilT